MTTKAQGPLAAMVRRLLGVYVGKPADTDTETTAKSALPDSPPTGGTRAGGNR